MACALLPAGLAAALPSPRRSAAASKGQSNQVACRDQLHWKLPLILHLISFEPHRSWSLVGRCTCSGSSTGAAMSRRSEDARQLNQVACTNQLHWKLPLSESHRSWSLVGCCTCSGSSTGAAISRRSADAMHALFGVGAIEIDGDDVVTPKGGKIIVKWQG
ncbi:hypothetical protein CFC21_021875 [Triticum aestivum]|uniref:Uncharacterized protein n=2 Tax=Triticum aestivum TaxID=4565 RepID=A0A3B6C0M0_WHEAT|nr:uncharacterized protein LOC123043771 isoform X2 [Triticum aestivum]KAF7006875.1 hypothetical protein CFC21_021875 [Triticum aestivum]